MLVDSDDLAASGDLAEEHGVASSTIAYWYQHADFPAPIVKLSTGPVWSRFAVREWVATRRREQEARARARLEREMADTKR